MRAGVLAAEFGIPCRKVKVGSKSSVPFVAVCWVTRTFCIHVPKVLFMMPLFWARVVACWKTGHERRCLQTLASTLLLIWVTLQTGHQTLDADHAQLPPVKERIREVKHTGERNERRCIFCLSNNNIIKKVNTYTSMVTGAVKINGLEFLIFK